MVHQLSSVTSIVGWVPFNEGWGEYDTARIARAVKAEDPTRMVVPNSGANCCKSRGDSRAGDIFDDHTYVGPGRPVLRDGRVTVDGEYGGLGLIDEGHRWPGPPMAYEMTDSKERLTQRYVEVSLDLERIVREVGLSGAIYTQTTDVENEVNGYMTYDRQIMKLDLPVVAATKSCGYRRGVTLASVWLTNVRRSPETGSSNSRLLRQQLQGPGEVVGRHVDHVRVQRVTGDRQPQRGHVHPQLMRAPGAGRQPVQALPRCSISVSAFGSPGSSTACNCPRRLMIRLRTTVGSSTSGSTPARAMYVLRTRPRANMRLICAAHLTSRREQQHAGRQPIEPVRRRQRGHVQFTPQPHQCRLRDMAAPRHRRQEVWFVDHDDVVVAMQDRHVEGHRNLFAQFAIQVDEGTGRQDRRSVDDAAVRGNHFAVKHFRRGTLAEPVSQLDQHGPAAQPHPRRAEPIAHRQRRGTPQLSGTGSRISARASGAAARSASADSSSGSCWRAHLGLDPRQVCRNLTVDVLFAPTQYGRNHFGDFARTIHAAVRVFDRDPHPPRQDVLQVQRPLGRRRVPRLHLQIHRRFGDRRQQFRPALGHLQYLADQRAVPVQQMPHPVGMQTCNAPQRVRSG